MEELYSKEFFNETKGRGAIYEYFSLVLREPVSESFIGLSGKFVEVFNQLGTESGSEDIIEGARILNEYAVKEKFFENKEKLLTDLNIQWTGIFLTGASNVPCSSSVAITGSEFDEPWERVMEYYKIRGFKKPESFVEADDHISMELLFMHSMCGFITKLGEERKYEIIHDVLKEQAVFLNNYMQDWVKDACNKMIAFCKKVQYELPLYLGTAYLLKGFIEYDKAYLLQITEENNSVSN